MPTTDSLRVKPERFSNIYSSKHLVVLHQNWTSMNTQDTLQYLESWNNTVWLQKLMLHHLWKMLLYFRNTWMTNLHPCTCERKIKKLDHGRQSAFTCYFITWYFPYFFLYIFLLSVRNLQRTRIPSEESRITLEQTLPRNLRFKTIQNNNGIKGFYNLSNDVKKHINLHILIW